MNKYYSTPKQVAFYDPNGSSRYIGGIALGDIIICAECGGTVEIAEVIEFAPEGIRPIIEYDLWVDFSLDILEDNVNDLLCEAGLCDSCDGCELCSRADEFN